jgi:beta-glucosidase
LIAGRPLALKNVVNKTSAMLMAWHSGTMAGPAIAELLFGETSPSGKLPVTFPRVTGQIPMYYAQKNTGRPPTPETIMHMDDIPLGARQLSVGNTSFHLDVEQSPLFPFGYGLSYTQFQYANIKVSANEIKLGETITISVELSNVGDRAAEEVAQLYVRDLAGSVTRPVRELRGFQRVRLKPGERTTVTFALHTRDLAFYNRKMQLVTEPGEFHVWVGGSSETALRVAFRISES